MKKKLIFILILILILMTGCENKLITNNTSDVFEDYFKEIEGLNNYQVSEFCNYKNYSLINNDFQGGLSAIVSNDTATYFYIDGQDIKVKLLGKENDSVKEIATEEVYTLPTDDIFTLNVFYISDDTTKYYLELNGSCTLFTDGSSLTLIPITISDNTIEVEDAITYSASAIYEEEITELKEKITSLGLTYSDTSKSIYEQTSSTKEIFKIERSHIDGFDLSNYLKTNTKVKYGYIKFSITEGNLFKDKEIEKNVYSDDYLGSYSYVDGNDTYVFQLQSNGDSVTYYLNYYPNNSTHAAEELWGDFSKTNEMTDINNENTNSIATYSFDKIEYNENSITIDITQKEILNESLKDYAIKSGTYTFTEE